MDQFDTIAAIATPTGVGGIGVIRVSGPEALTILSKLFFKKSASFESHRLYHGWVKESLEGPVLDEGMASFMRAPHSFTGEDVVEVSGHGNPTLLKQILERFFFYGARPAEPGEFTKRAFLNGKLDLNQAEALNDLISSKTTFGIKGALKNLSGGLSSSLSGFKSRIIDLLAILESKIDFSEDLGDLDRVDFCKKIEKIVSDLRETIDRSQSSHLLREGIRVILFGKPNVGKSSLLNAILSRERAIVSQIPGTTRDTIEESFPYKGMLFHIIDTAGWREVNEEVEREGVKRTQGLLEGADIPLLVLDGSQGLTEEDYELLRRLSKEDLIIVVNKSDLDLFDSSKLTEIISNRESIFVSAKNGNNIESLKNMIFDFSMRKLNIGSQDQNPILITKRQSDSLMKAHNSMQSALFDVQNGIPEDCIAIKVKSSLLYLSEMTGENLSEEVISRVFSDFCVGK